MQNNKKLIVTLSVVIVIGVGIHSLSSTQASLPASVKSVAVSEVRRENLARSVTMSAEFRPFQEIDLRAKEAGYLKTLTVDIGDEVKAGQVIATLDIDELKDDLSRTTAAYHDAQLDYDRVSVVIKKRPGLLAQEEVDKAQATYEMAKANMGRAKTLLEYATITVPFNGIVTKRYADPGALIQSSGNSETQAMPLVHIADNTKLRLIFPVPESIVPQIHVGTPVGVTVQATGQTLHSSVARVAGKIDSGTRTMDTEVDIDNTQMHITPGMYASVAIDLDRKENVLALPVQAVSAGDKPNVWRINEKHQIEEVPVKVGLQTADKVEIKEGLQEGDQVVFGSRGKLNTGLTVEPKRMSETNGS